MERLANDFQNMECLTNMKLSIIIKQVFLIVSDAINFTNWEIGAAGHIKDITNPLKKKAGTGKKKNQPALD